MRGAFRIRRQEQHIVWTRDRRCFLISQWLVSKANQECAIAADARHAVETLKAMIDAQPLLKALPGLFERRHLLWIVIVDHLWLIAPGGRRRRIDDPSGDWITLILGLVVGELEMSADSRAR